MSEITMHKIKSCLLEYDSIMGAFPESKYEGMAVFAFLSDKFLYNLTEDKNSFEYENNWKKSMTMFEKGQPHGKKEI